MVSPVPVAMVRMQDGDTIRDRRARLAGGDRQRPFARTCLPGRRCGQADDRRRPGAAADHLERLAEPQRARGRSARRMAGLDREAAASCRTTCSSCPRTASPSPASTPASTRSPTAIAAGSTRSHDLLAEPRRARRLLPDPVRPQDRRRLARPRHRRGDGASAPSRGRGPSGARGARRRPLVFRGAA